MGPRFESTAWSVIATAQGTDAASARHALHFLCQRYWQPLYAFLRSKGHKPEAAEDLTQEFFAHLLSRDLLQKVQPDRGRFRTFLLACLNRFLLDERDRSHAAKRGGGTAPVSLDFRCAEERFSLLYSNGEDPRMAFDRAWAEALLDKVAARLESEYREAGNIETFRALQGYLGRGESLLVALAAAEQLGISAGAVRVAIHRMRRRFAALTREEIAQTVDGVDAVDQELAYLVQVMGG